ncbi:MAG: Uma2 family endonuclease [Bryobacterales bacterium]|nr:Uma2 family endonuclease [Bryobacterales bacterium]
MASTPTTLVSVEDYLARTEKPNAEYEDGVIYPKPMRTFSHSELEYTTTHLLREQGVIALPELTMRVSTSPMKFLVPDVAVVRRIEGDYLTEPAILCVEILSPEQRLGEMLAKCELYHAWGVPYCWVIDPGKRSAWEYHKNGEPVKLAPNGTLRAGELSVPLSSLFAGLHE